MFVSCIVASGLVSLAQVSAANRADTGFPVGEKSKLHAFAKSSFIFDSNPFRSDQALDVSDQADFRIVVRPGFEVEVPGRSVELKLRTAGAINYLAGLSSRGDSDVLFGLEGGVDLRVGSDESSVQLLIDDTLVRTPTLIDDPGSIGSDEIVFRNWSNSGKAGVVLRPGGRALEFEFAYLNKLFIYDNLDDGIQHGGMFEARYRFLPKTALVFHADFSGYDPSLLSPNSASTLRSTPLNILMSAIGQLTPRISAELGVGYGNTLTWTGDFFSDREDATRETVIAVARAKYAFGPMGDVSLAYRRSVDPVIIFDAQSSDAVELSTKVRAGRLVAQGLVSYENRRYGGAVDDGVEGIDVIIGDIGADYYFFSFLSSGMKFRIIEQISDQSADPLDPTTAFVFGEFTRYQFIASTNLRY